MLRGPDNFYEYGQRAMVHGLPLSLPEPKPQPKFSAPCRRHDAILTLQPSIQSQDPFFLHRILEAVAGHFRVTVEDMKSPRRLAYLTNPRRVYCYIARKESTASFPMIARLLGGRDHSTIIHAINSVEDARDRYSADIAAVMKRLGAMRGAA